MEDKDKLSGAALPWPFKDDRGIAIDPDMPIVTAEQRATWNKMYEAAMPKLKDSHKNRMIIIGTGGDMESDQDFTRLFYDPYKK